MMHRVNRKYAMLCLGGLLSSTMKLSVRTLCYSCLPLRPHSSTTMDSDSDTASLTDNDHEVIADGPYSTVYKSIVKGNGGEENLAFVTKRASGLKTFSKEPHDIKKELLILKSLDHCNARIFRDLPSSSSLPLTIQLM